MPGSRGAARFVKGAGSRSTEDVVSPSPTLSGEAILQSAHTPPTVRTASAVTSIGTSTRGVRAILGFHVFSALSVKPLAKAAAKTSVGIAIASIPSQDCGDRHLQLCLLHYL